MKAENPTQNYYISLFDAVVETLGIKFNMSQSDYNEFAIMVANRANDMSGSMFREGHDVVEIDSAILNYYSSFTGDVNGEKVLSCIETYFSDLPSSDFEMLKKDFLEVKQYIENKLENVIYVDNEIDLDSISENQLIVEIMSYCENVGIKVAEK